MVKCLGLVLLTAFAFARGHVNYWNTPNKLQPVHGLYVKPSVDGTTGDLYVAATEDNGVKSQWLTDQPVGFLPAPTAHPQALPVAYNPNVALSDDALNPQKRAVVNAPMQYAYAYPVPGQAESNSIVPYPYSIPTPNSGAANMESSNRNPDAAVAAGIPQYQPLQYFYPQMMSAYADLLNAFKESAAAVATTAASAATNEETETTASPQSASMWPYAYPVQYIMVDPTMWAQSQAAVVASTPSTTTSATVVDNE